MDRRREFPTPRALLTILLLALSAGASAAWVEVDRNAHATYYSDPSSIRRSGHIVEMWSLLDFRAAQHSRAADEVFLSAASRFEYDCDREQLRQTFLAWHAEPMGRGDIVHSETTSAKWNDVPPDSILKKLWQAACAKP